MSLYTRGAFDYRYNVDGVIFFVSSFFLSNNDEVVRGKFKMNRVVVTATAHVR